MKFNITARELSTTLNYLSNCVEKKQTMPVLANVLLQVSGNILKLTSTNIETEMVVCLHLMDMDAEDGEITVDLRKLQQICKSLRSDIHFCVVGNVATVTAGKSRFQLQTLPADHFPNLEIERADNSIQFTLNTKPLEREINRVQFAMAQQDVRYYLNGMQWSSNNGVLRLASSDGHRLAISTLECSAKDFEVIMPRKSVLDVAKLLGGMGEETTVIITDSHIRFMSGDYIYTSKLVEGKFPDINRVIPTNNTRKITFDKSDMKSLLQQGMITANENGQVIMTFANNSINLTSTNVSQESVVCEMPINDSGEELRIGFNGHYIIDALNNVSGDTLVLSLLNENTSSLIESANDSHYKFVVMPMRV